MTSCNGIWGHCSNAVHTLDKGWPVMRCKMTGKHPDECAAIGDRSPTGPGRETGPVHESPGAGTAIAQ